MSDVLSREFPPPTDWQSFERLSFDLYRRLWKTNDAEMHGRTGQPQSGVDVFGHDRVEGKFVGIQCKGKDSGFGHPLTEAELRDEVKKALTFQPPIDVYVVVTTGLNDSKIQAVAREISERHKHVGKFEVRVTGWTTLKQLITDYADLVVKHFRDIAPVDVAGAIHDFANESRIGINQILATLHRHHPQIISEFREAKDGDDPLIPRIAELSKLSDDGSATVALRALTRLLETERSASSRALYRLHASIGGTLNALGREADAIQSFHKAYAADPDHPPAMAILATALLMEGNREEARAMAQRALTLDGQSMRAAEIVIDAARDDTPLAEIEASLPESLRARWEARLALSLRAHHRKLSCEALRYAEEALALAPEDWRTQSGVAEALMAPLAAMDGIEITRAFAPELRGQIARATDLLRMAWATLLARETSFQGRHVAANLISLLDLQGETEEAVAALEEALTRHADYAPLIRRQAQRLAGEGQWGRLNALFDAIPEAERNFQDWLVRAQTAIELADVKSAQLAHSRLHAAVEHSEQKEFAAAVGAEIAILAGEAPITAIRTALVNYPRSVLIRSIILDQFDQGDSDRATLLDELAGLVDGDLTSRERLHAAEALYAAGRHVLAATLYGPLHGNDVDSFALRRHLQSLYLADRRLEARALYETLPLGLRRSANYVGIGINIYERAGLLKPALDLLEGMFPERDELRDRLAWAHLRARVGRVDPVKLWLRQVSREVEGKPRELLMLAQLIDRHLGGDDRSLAFGYRALRAGYNDPQVHLGYSVGLFLNGRGGQRQIETPDRLIAGAAIVLARRSDNQALRRVIEIGADPRTERDEIAPGDPLAMQLLGLAKGDEITIDRLGAAPDVYVVQEVQSRYVFALQRSMREFNSLFPGNRGLGSFEIDESKGDNKFDELLVLAQGNAADTIEIEKVYRESLMPIILLARFVSGSAFDVWQAFAAAPSFPVKVAFGLSPEFEAARRACATTHALIVDPLTIYSWARLDLLGVIAKGSGKLAIVQSTVDLLRHVLEERCNKIGREMGSFGWDGAGYRFIRLTPEALDQEISVAEAALRFAETLRLVPAESRKALPESASELFAGVDVSFVDTLIAATADGHGLLADDLGYRLLVQEAGASVAWTQTFLQFLGESGTVNLTEYVAATGTLFEAGYDFTMFGYLELIRELLESNWTITPRLALYAGAFAKPTIDEKSMNAVLAGLIAETLRLWPGDLAVAAFHKAVATAMRDAGEAEKLYRMYNAAMRTIRQSLTRDARRRIIPKRARETTSLTSPQYLASEADALADRIVERTTEAIQKALAGSARSADWWPSG